MPKRTKDLIPEKRVSGHDEILIEMVQEIRKLIEAPKPRGKPKAGPLGHSLL
jgi:hypothetical protein